MIELLPSKFCSLINLNMALEQYFMKTKLFYLLATHW